jgi:hypothetical protein
MVAMLKSLAAFVKKVQAYRLVVNFFGVLGGIWTFVRFVLDNWGRAGDAVDVGGSVLLLPATVWIGLAIIAIVVLANWVQLREGYDRLFVDEASLADELGKFLEEGQALMARAQDHDQPLPTEEANDWGQRLEEFVRERMGVAKAAVLTNFSGMTFFSNGSDRANLRNGIDGRLRRIVQFIEAQPHSAARRKPEEGAVEVPGEANPQNWRLIAGLVTLFVVAIAAASYTTYKFTSAGTVDATAKTPGIGGITLDVTKPSLEVTQAEEIKRLRKQLDEMGKERDDAKSIMHEREFKLLQAREAAEKSFASKARALMERALIRSDKYLYVYTLNIEVLEELMAVTVQSDDDLADWLLRYEQTKLVVNHLSPMYGQDISINESPPPTRVLKQFRAFNAKHNETLNDIDYHVERLKKEIEGLVPKPIGEP